MRARCAASFTETRTYNANLQLTELVSGTSVHLKYNYWATQNNGRLQSQTDVISGETVAYTYDSLNRLIQASAPGDPSGGWSHQFTCDSDGNLSAYGTGSFAVSYSYDNENRLTVANPGILARPARTMLELAHRDGRRDRLIAPSESQFRGDARLLFERYGELLHGRG